MTIYQINAGHVSRPRVVGAGNVVSIRPDAGATAIVEYTLGSAADVMNNAAAWNPWPKGPTTTAKSDQVNKGGYIRVTAQGGNVTYEVDDLPANADASPFLSDWSALNPGSGVAPTITGTPGVNNTLTAKLPDGVVGTLQWTRTTKAVPPVKSPIAGAVANLVNSLAYVQQAADGGCAIGCDASNQVSPSASVDVPMPASAGYARKVQGLSQPFGDLMSGALTNNSSWRTVRRFPAPFKRIRCYLYNLDTGNAMAGAKAGWSPSESLAGVQRPTIGGVTSDASQAQFLFGGVNSVTLPMAPAVGVPSITVSDWMNVGSIATTDGNPYPIGYFTNLFTSGAQIGYSDVGGQGTRQAFLEGLSGMKHAFRSYQNNGDCVSNPALFTATGYGSVFAIPMGIEVEYFSGVRTMIVGGDSTLQGAGNTAMTGAGLQVLAQTDAVGNPVDAFVIAQIGSSAARMDTKIRNLAAINIPDTIYFQVFSVNDTSNYAGSAQATMDRVDYWVSWCAANSVNLIMETPLPIKTAGSAAVTTTELAALTSMSQYILSKASAAVKVLDLSGLHSAPYSGVWNTTYGFDNYHPNPAGHTFRTAALHTAIQALG